MRNFDETIILTRCCERTKLSLVRSRPARLSSCFTTVYSLGDAGDREDEADAEKERVPMRPVVIAVAITGSVPRKRDNPAVPITPAEQIESIHEAFEAGASLVHIHVRNSDESPSSDPALFAQVQKGVRALCPGIIVQFSTGGRGRDPAARGSALFLQPDMASLATGSVNFPTIIYENSATFVEALAAQLKEHYVLPEIEVFDLSHIHGARKLVDLGLINDRPHVQFVMGIKNALPAAPEILNHLRDELRRVLPNSTWTAAGIGRYQSEVMNWALAKGADAIRTGLEDNIRITKDRLARSNAELVQIAVAACERHGRRSATPAEARAILGLPT
jgi:3-keto-5-aminohexanoate cleavage enzyme